MTDGWKSHTRRVQRRNAVSFLDDRYLTLVGDSSRLKWPSFLCTMNNTIIHTTVTLIVVGRTHTNYCCHSCVILQHFCAAQFLNTSKYDKHAILNYRPMNILVTHCSHSTTVAPIVSFPLPISPFTPILLQNLFPSCLRLSFTSSLWNGEPWD